MSVLVPKSVLVLSVLTHLAIAGVIVAFIVREGCR